MKYKILSALLISASMLCLHANAQKEISVSQVNKLMSRGTQPGYSVNIPEAKLKDAESDWKKYLSKDTKSSTKQIKDEIVNYGCVNRNFSAFLFIVYSTVHETMEGVEVSVFVSEDSLSFISDTSNADKVNAIKKYLRDFSVMEYKKIKSKELETVNETLKDLKKNLENLYNKESSNTKDISQLQRENENLKTKIETNKSDQTAATAKISKQQDLVESIGDKQTPEYQLANSNLNNYRGDKKQLEKDAEKMARNIDKNNQEIKSLEHKNEDLKTQQQSAKDKITVQQKVVDDMDALVKNIK